MKTGRYSENLVHHVKQGMERLKEEFAQEDQIKASGQLDPHEYAAREEIYVLVTRIGATGWTKAEVVGASPIGEIPAVYGKDEHDALRNLRWKFCCELVARGHVSGERAAKWAAARKRAALLSLYVADRLVR